MYRSPVEDILFSLRHVAGLKDAVDAGLFGELDWDTVASVVSEAGRFATDVIAPLNRPGDLEGAHYENGVVTSPKGFKQAYKQWVEGGWAGVTAPADQGGMGLPHSVNFAATEIWNGASIGFALCPLLSEGALGALNAYASPDLRETYVKRLASGEWTGTMNLTEPQAGSDLNAVKSRAERADDGAYRVFGQKIYITYGEHDFVDNIVHLVLARLPDAPAGTRGLSLFLVPKFLVKPDGSLGARNDVRCASIEHKLGIHASPTCVMIYGDNGGATGFLVGEENRGLAAMFVMMNSARLGVGLQGVAVAERAYQGALEYARERRQGRVGAAAGMSPIIEHPDVQRMLLTMKAQLQAARGICHLTGVAIDLSRHAATREAREEAAERSALLTPIAKAWSTDIGDEVASMGVQVHGGMGYIEETGAAQHMRDARICAIYEGTNGVQAVDLVTRKITLGQGQGGGARNRVRARGRGRRRRRRGLWRLRRAAGSGGGRAGAGDRFSARRARRRARGGAGRRQRLPKTVRAGARRRVPRQGRSRRGRRSRAHRARPLLRRKALRRGAGLGRQCQLRGGGFGRRRGGAQGGCMTVLVERDGGVLVVTLNRPEKKNALTGDMYRAMRGALATASAEADIGAVLVMGAGGAFSAGNDLGDFLAANRDGAERARENPAGDFINAIARFDKPIVAAVEGVAVGVGTTMCLHCDLVYAAPSARFATPFVNLGLVPEAGSSWLAPRRFGLAVASELLLLGEPMEAARAHAIGLISTPSSRRRSWRPMRSARPRRWRQSRARRCWRPES